MGAEVIIIVFCICCCCSSLAALYLYPYPKLEPSSIIDGYKEISGRAVYNNQDAPSNEDADLCSKDCNIDFTCRGFNAWTTGEGINIRNYCLKQTSNVDPFTTIPAYIVGKNGSKIFVKSS